MQQQPTPTEIENRRNEIRAKRIATMVGAYRLMARQYREVRENTVLNNSLVAATVEDYLRDREALVSRHNITGRIQRHKIAGMMAAAITKNHPIQLLDTEAAGARISRDNETLAVLHGLAVCAEGKSDDEIRQVMRVPNFATWFSDFVYLLHRHPSNTESFIMIFGTLSLTYFGNILEHSP